MTLELYYKFDNDYKDYSGNGRNGTATGMNLVTGKVNKAIENLVQV